MSCLSYLLLAIVILIVWVGLIDSDRNERARDKKVQEIFSGRNPLTPEGFYEQYFLNTGVAPGVVIGIRKILEEQFRADMSRLNAEDDFSKNLSFFFDLDSMADVELVIALENHFNIKIADSEAGSIRTISELVQLVSSKVRDDRSGQ